MNVDSPAFASSAPPTGWCCLVARISATELKISLARCGHEAIISSYPSVSMTSLRLAAMKLMPRFLESVGVIELGEHERVRHRIDVD